MTKYVSSDASCETERKYDNDNSILKSNTQLCLLFCEGICHSKLFCLFMPSALVTETYQGQCLGVVPLRARHSRDISLALTSDDVLKTSLRM